VNIFYLDHDVQRCAEMHNDKHCIKMILEYCQLLSTAHRVLDGSEYIVKSKTGRNVKRWLLNDVAMNDKIYSATHNHHPSAVWARESKENYLWLANLLVALCGEYTYRYGKIHKCQQTGLVDLLLNNTPKNISDKSFTGPTPAMPDDVKIVGDSLSSYRNYYNLNKTHLASWKGKINSRNIPEWFNANIRI
jgi:hypothetical protein